MKLPISIEILPPERQAYVLAMVHFNLFPKGIIVKRHSWFGKTKKGFDCLSGKGFYRLTELQSMGYSEEAQRGHEVAKNHWSDWAERAVNELLAPLTDCKVNEAISIAEHIADASGLPQTVYRDANSAGWASTNALANRLDGAEKLMTALPIRYFN